MELPKIEEKNNVKISSIFSVKFVLENNGCEKWPSDSKLKCVNGIYKDDLIEINPIDPNCISDINFALPAPDNEGKFFSEWRISYKLHNDFKYFGPKIGFEVCVKTSLNNKKKFSESLIVRDKVQGKNEKKYMH